MGGAGFKDPKHTKKKQLKEQNEHLAQCILRPRTYTRPAQLRLLENRPHTHAQHGMLFACHSCYVFLGINS